MRIVGLRDRRCVGWRCCVLRFLLADVVTENMYARTANEFVA
jgi:hypothetical protein